MALILFSQVNKKVNKDIALKNLNFNIKRNEFVFIYENKRELIKTISSLLSGKSSPDKGLIRINNQKKFSPEIKKKIAVIHDDNLFLSDRSIEENFKFILGLFGKRKKYPDLRIKKLLKIVDLEKYNKYKPGELLAHQYIRASIARSLLLYPSIIVMEDPLINIDEVNTQAIYHLLKKINKFNITIVFICSELNFIKRNKSEKIIYLNENHYSSEKEGYHV